MNKHHSDISYTVELATLSDIPGMLAVLEENLLIKKDRSAVSQIEQSGFLIRKHSVEELSNWIQDKENHITLVYKEANEVIGYILGCDMEALPPEWQAKFADVSSLKDVIAAHPILYHKQIAIKPNRKGVGSKLLQRFFEITLMKKYHHIICFIVHGPILNKVSVDFHQKHGFEYHGLIQVDDMQDGVYLKQLK